MQAEEAPTKIKGAGELLSCDFWRVPLWIEVTGWVLWAWILGGLLLVLLDARKGGRPRGLVVYGLGGVASLICVVGLQWFGCAAPTPHRIAGLALRLGLPMLGMLVLGGAIAWGIGRLLRPRKVKASA